MERFRETLAECKLSDIGFSGVSFTWERGNLPETNIRERLDRGVANDEWISLFPLGRVQHLPFSTSDHCPLLINTARVNPYSRHRRFHFEAWWTMEESFEEVLRGLWGSSSGLLMEKLKVLQNERNDETLARIIDTKIHLNMEIEKDEVYWEQRARVNWLQYGDKNTTYFHKSATTRRRANFITKLVADDGKKIVKETELQEAAKIFFEKLFSFDGVADPKRILEGVDSCISPEMNEVLNSPFTADEILVALKGMGPLKAPGSDGFPALFFQKYWQIVGKDVLDFVWVF
ncbi:reverse transcriptase [Gossypium australe]|uniref:Reverse transcriptase n=1 Tax=Gossypium australe TaxID=47621 RepID=A0A5B6X1L1_9ROSI|nr:reverse transcriptase [Gossypium australe]